MKVVLVGGYGVFGSLLARLLVRDGHRLWIAGRDPDKARAAAAGIGAEPLRVDLFTDPAAVFAAGPEAVIDAAGPFQYYGDDPYRLPRLCIERGVHYLDLSDAAAFTGEIGTLDDAARAAGVFVLSGASSVPGLSSAVVTALGADLDEILLIDTAILPGNRAPRGNSVIESIVGGAGRSSKVWRGGGWRRIRGWTAPRRYRLAADLGRTGYFVDVPDVELFPAHFRARSVLFRAGLELGAMNRGLSALAWLRRWRFFELPRAALAVVRWLADRLRPFGSDRGGMQVTVVGRREGETLRRVWSLVAEAGEGPYIPGIVARALLRRASEIAPGARPCLAEIPLVEAERAMADLAVTTDTAEAPSPSLFERVLGERWRQLPTEIRDLHGVQDIETFSGLGAVTRGNSRIARLAAWCFRFPHAGIDLPVRVTKTRTARGEIWERSFAGRTFRSRCSAAPGLYRFRERFGPFAFEMELPVEKGEMRFPVRRGWFLGVPIPRRLLPKSETWEYVDGGVFHFDVALTAPLGGGLIVRYRGWLKPDRGEAETMRTSDG